jgi:tetratricopeptide (TPR) repeat protein
MAVEEGSEKAMNNLAHLYYNQGNHEIAEKYYLMAIEKGNEEAMNNLAHLYYNQENHEIAEKYYLMAIEKGNEEAMFNLALLYDYQEKYELAEKYYLMAIEKGDENAMNNLALIYDNNQGKFELAEKYYLKAVEKDYEKAMFNIALFYYNQGKFDLAEKYFLMAIEKGNVRALYNICFLYYLIVKDKNKLNAYYPQIIKNSTDERQLVILSEIWNGVFTNIKEDIEKLTTEENGFDQIFLTHLLVHFQKNIVWELFNKPEIGQQLKDKFLPVYYATASLIDTEESLSVMLKMPPEIEETVKDILSEIEKLRKEYYPESN